MSLYKVTYYRFKKEEMEGVDIHEENVDDSIVYLIRPSIFSTSAYEIDYYYTWENNAIGKIYKPGSKIEPDSPDMFTADTTLYAAWKKSNTGALILINEGVETDISDLLYGADVIYGKNQPFPYGEVEISKQMFNSDDYWASRAEMSAYQGESPPITNKPILIQGSTRIKIGVYGIEGEWEFQKTKDDGQKYSLVCVHPAHRLKDLKLDTLFEVKDYNEGGPSVKFPNIFGDAPFALNPNSSITGPPKIWEITDFMGSGVTVYVEVGVPTSPTVSRIEGTHANIFKLLVHLGLGIDYSDMKVDAGTTYISQGYTFNTTYTTEEMSSLKANKAPIASNTNLSTTALRAQGNAWEALLSLGYMVNADIFFYDKAYFVDYQSPDTVVDKLHLNYGNEAVDGWVTEEVINIVKNKDQGSQAIQTAQTVHSENYSTSISVSGGANTIIEGADVKCLIPDYIPTFDVPSSKDNKIYQVKTIALNLLLKNYLPGDVISYSTSEIRRADVQYPEDFNIQSVTDKAVGTIAQVGTGYFSDYYIYVQNPDESKVWIEYKFNVTPQRKEKYSIYSFANEIHDAQNNLDLVDTKLALTHISYPSCITTYVWGNPEFLDAEQAMTDVEMGVADATISGTDDTQISDKYSAMMVYGNLGVSELPEDRGGFTGMILEKNWDKELYRFVGYEDGEEQAMFDTDGKIVAGAGSVQLDAGGLTIYFNPTDTEFIKQNALTFRRRDTNFDISKLYTEFDTRYDRYSTVLRSESPPDDPNSTQVRIYSNEWNFPETNFVSLRGGTVNGNSYNYDWNHRFLYTDSNNGYVSDTPNSGQGVLANTVAENFSDSSNASSIYVQAPSATHSYAMYALQCEALYTPKYLPGAGEWSIELESRNIYMHDNQTPYGYHYRPASIRIAYIPWGYSEKQFTPWVIFNSTSYSKTEFKLNRLDSGGFRSLEIQIRYESSAYWGAYIYVKNAKIKFKEYATGGELVIWDNNVRLLGNISMHGTIDGVFQPTPSFKQSMRRVFDGIYATKVNTSYSADTWYRNNSINAMVLMYTNASTFGAISLCDEDGHYYYKVVEGAVQNQGSGWGGYTAICPPGWSFRFEGANSKRYLTFELRI